MRIAELDGFLIGCEIYLDSNSIYVEKMRDREDINRFDPADNYLTLMPAEAAALGSELIRAAAELGYKEPAIELVAIDNAKSHGDKELELYNEKAAADKSWALHQQFCNTSCLTFSASDLAARAREAKAGKRDMQEVIDDHDDYLMLVKNGGLLVPPSAADVDFVEKNITHLKDVYHGN